MERFDINKIMFAANKDGENGRDESVEPKNSQQTSEEQSVDRTEDDRVIGSSTPKWNEEPLEHGDVYHLDSY